MWSSSSWVERTHHVSDESGAERCPDHHGVGVQGQVPQAHGRGGGERRGDRHHPRTAGSVSRLVPYRARPESLFGIDRGRFEIIGDIVEPVDVEWEAESTPDRVIVIVLDTHVLLWLRSGDRRLGAGARSEIERAWRASEVCVSAYLVLGSGSVEGQGAHQIPRGRRAVAPRTTRTGRHRGGRGRGDRHPGRRICRSSSPTPPTG